MPLEKTTNRWSYTGNGVTTAFTYDNVIFAATDMLVFLDGVLQGSGYTVDGVGDPDGGNVNFTVPPANLAEIVLLRAVPYTQPEDLVNNQPVDYEVVEVALNRATVLIQQLVDDGLRKMRLADGDPALALAELPTLSSLAGLLLGFDSSDPPAPVGVAITAANPNLDTLLSTLQEGHLLVYDNSQSKWVNSHTVTAALTMRSADPAGAAAPLFGLFRDSVSPAVADLLGALQFPGRNAAAEKTTYGQITAEIVDPADGAEAGGLIFEAIVAGALTELFRGRKGIFTPGALGGDKLADSINAGKFYTHGNLLLPKWHGAGLEMSRNGVSPDTVLDIAAGEVVDDTQSDLIVNAAVLSKVIEAIFVAGDDNGGLVDAAEIVADNTISFDNATSKILGAALPAGFLNSEKVIVEDSASNDQAFSITATGAGELTVSPAPTTEAAGASITLHRLRKAEAYHVYLIRNPSTGAGDAIYSRLMVPTLPAGFTQKARLGAWVTGGTALLLDITQRLDHFYHNTPIGDGNGSSSGVRTLRTLSVPTGLKLWPKTVVSYGLTATPETMIVTDPDEADVAPTASVHTLKNDGSTGGQTSSSTVLVMTDTQGRIGVRATNAAAIPLVTFGWEDPRWRI